MTVEPSSSSPVSVWDVAIVGGGLAGASAAAVLGRQRHRVILLDSRATYPASFKAEKIEPDQAALFRKLGLLEGLLPAARRIREIISARGRLPFRSMAIEQYGILYQDMVNGVRGQIPANVERKTARAQEVVPGADGAHVTLMNGEILRARLVVLACGTGGHLLKSLGIGKRMLSEAHSLTVGFNLKPESGVRLPFDSLTYYPSSSKPRVAFLSLFPIRDMMRANYFTYWKPGDPQVDEFQKDPLAALIAAFPRLLSFTGRFQVTGRIEMGLADLYRVEAHLQPGLVLIGDAFQSVCPTTGTGLSKVLTDVDVLCKLIPEWLRSSEMGTKKISEFYNDPQKVASDRQSLEAAFYCRNLSLSPSLWWRVRRRSCQ